MDPSLPRIEYPRAAEAARATEVRVPALAYSAPDRISPRLVRFRLAETVIVMQFS